MIPAAGMTVVLVLVAALHVLRIDGAAARAIRRSRESLGVLRDATISDVEKERSARASAVALGTDFVGIAGRGMIALVASLGGLLLWEASGLVRAAEALAWLASPRGLLATSVALVAWVWGGRRV